MPNPIPLDRDQRIIDKVKEMLANPPEGSVVLEITPHVAQWIMTNLHGRNRRRKGKAIQQYAEDIRHGFWTLNGATIVFTDVQRLGDGQNRLIACIRAEKAFKTHVVFGIDDRCFDTIDQGRVRNASDLLHLDGVVNSTLVMPAVRWAQLLESGTVKRRTVFSPRQILELYHSKHKAVEDWVAEARAIYKINHQPIGMVMALLYCGDKVAPEFASDFAEAWGAGVFDPDFSPIAKLEAETTKLRLQQNGRVHEVVRMAMMVNTWNACRAGLKGRGNVIRWELHARKPFPTMQ